MTSPSRPIARALLTTALVATAAGGASAAARPSAPSGPPNPAQFSSTIDNPYLPFCQGRRWSTGSAAWTGPAGWS